MKKNSKSSPMQKEPKANRVKAQHHVQRDIKKVLAGAEGDVGE